MNEAQVDRSPVPQSGAASWLLSCLVATALVLPSVVWVWLDTAAWGGDQSQYGFATLELVHTLTTSPAQWPARLLEIFPWKPNGLLWLGQGFVALTPVVPSVDTALLFTIVFVQALAIAMTFRALSALTSGRLVIATIGSLVVASAPQFITFAHHYLVESFQVMSVAWFILIMAMAPRWSRALVLAQLVAATVVALAAKQTQPLFCIWPGAVICWELVRPRRSPLLSSSPRATIATWTLVLPVAAATGAWYLRNHDAVLAHLREGTYGQGVKTLWGKEDTYLNTLRYWIDAARESNFINGLGEACLVLAVLAAGLYFLNRHRPEKRFTLCAAVAALQLLTVVFVFSLSPTRQARYFLPALPFLAMVIGWSLAQINVRALTVAAFCGFATQFVFIHGQALSLLPANSAWVRPVERDAKSGRVLEGIVARTCAAPVTNTRWNILAVDPSIPQLRGDWLAPDPANYVVAKQRLRHGGALGCHFGYIGDGFFGADVNTAWTRLEAHQTQYVIVLDQAAYPPPAQVFNQTLSRERFPELLGRLESSADFVLEPRLAADPGVLIFHRADRVAKGRALSDEGKHDLAIAMLQQAADAAPANAEAWANLALAFERRGSSDGAIKAGLRATQLNPRHYYATLIVARGYAAMQRWPDALAYAREAAGQAPSATERAAALNVAAQAAFAVGQAREGCELLRQSGSLADPAVRSIAPAACGG